MNNKNNITFHIFLWLFYCLSTLSIAQNNISHFEYYIDQDPGKGSGVKVEAPSTNTDINFTISTENLNNGIHLLGIRAWNGKLWTHTLSKYFSTSTNLTEIEYFFDTDPGIGNGIKIETNNINDFSFIEFDLSTENLTAGIHTLGIRSKVSGLWSSTLISIIHVCKSNSELIERVEYFFNNDPGIGNGIGYDIANIDINEDIAINIPCDTLETGIHTLGLRTKINGLWSTTLNKIFAVTRLDGIEELEYFYDIDPGLGNGHKYPISGLSLNSEIELNLLCDTLQPGIHQLGLRTKINGLWSQTLKKVIAIQEPGKPLEYIEYFWNNDPGIGKATEIAVSGSEIEIINIDFDVNNLSYGNNALFIRAKSNGLWSVPFVHYYCKNAEPLFSFDDDEICINEPFIIYNNTIDAQSNTTFKWYMDASDNNVNYTESDDFIHTYSKAGVYTIKLIVETNGSCESEYKKEITVYSKETPTLKITSPKSKICEGENMLFIANKSNLGKRSKIKWYKNDELILNQNRDSIILSDLKNNDIIYAKAENSNKCSDVADVTSNTIKVNVDILDEIILPPLGTIYTDNSSFILNHASPEGGKYYINGKESTLFNPKRNEVGKYELLYVIQNSSGCSKEAIDSFLLKEREFFDINVSTNDETLGSVSGSGNFLEGNSITISANPKENSYFIGWYDENNDLVSKEKDYSFVVNGNKNYNAKFAVNVNISSVENNKINIYPVPAKDYIFISGINKGYIVSINDISGKLLLREVSSKDQIKINIENLTAGTYLINIEYDNISVTKMIIKE